YKIVHCTVLLLYIMDNQLLIWNPSLKETRWVKCGSDFHWFDDAYGLGYIRQSPSNHDYRLVRFRCALSRGNYYWICLRKDSSKAFIQSFDFSKERFQFLDHLPFEYDEYNPLALETFRGNRLSVLEQCHQTKKISIWVRHLITPWTILMVVDIPNFSLVCQPSPRVNIIRPWLYRSHFSINYFVDKNDTLFTSLFGDKSRSVSVYRVRDKEFQKVFADTAGNSCYGNYSNILCNYVPSLVTLHEFSK
ncbi:hypothetical protein EUTSA_v10011043mg, partial [Eutrema salsugineum]